MEKQELFCHLKLNLLAIYFGFNAKGGGLYQKEKLENLSSELKWSLRGLILVPSPYVWEPINYEFSAKTISKENIYFLIPEVTGTDEALALVSLVTGLSAGYLADVWTEPFLHYCQRYCDQPAIKHRKLNVMTYSGGRRM